jgi:hypothetical protein
MIGIGVMPSRFLEVAFFEVRRPWAWFTTQDRAPLGPSVPLGV